MYLHKHHRALLLSTALLSGAQLAHAQNTVYWDGSDTVANGAVDGGAGTWDDAATNWTSSDGSANSTADGLGAQANRIFSGTAGTVNITAAAAKATELRFSASGYQLTGNAVQLQGQLVLDTGVELGIANSLTVGTTIIGSNSTLTVGAGGSTGAISGVVTNNGTLVFDRSDTVDFGKTISGSGLIRQQGSGELSLSRQSGDTVYTYAGNVEVLEGRFSPGRVTLTGQVTLNGGTFFSDFTYGIETNFTIGENGGTFDATLGRPSFKGVLSGTGKLTKTGFNFINIGNDNTFSGGFDILEGDIRVQNADDALTSPFGSGQVTISDGIDLTFYNDVSVPNSIMFLGTGRLVAPGSGELNFSGNINMGGNDSILALGGAAGINHQIRFSGSLSNGGFLMNLSAAAFKNAVLEFNGNAANTYTGLTRMQTKADSNLSFRLNKADNTISIPGDLTLDHGSTVIVVSDEQIANTSTVQLDEGANLTLGFEGSSVTETLNTLNGAGAVELSGLSILRVASGSLSGVISGDGALVKQDNGTLVLAGNNTFTGNSTVSAGQLQVTGSLTGLVLVDSGATLSGTGTVTQVMVADAAIVEPGTSAGTLSTGNLFLESGSVLNFELDAPGTVGGGVNDLIQVSGDLTLDGQLNVTDLGSLAAGTYTLLTYTGELTDNGLTLNTIPAGFIYTLDTATANAIRLVVADPVAVLTRSSAELDFGSRSITAAAAATRVLTLSNEGNIPLNVGNLTITGTHAGEFTITADTCSNSAVAVGGSCSVTVSQQGVTSGVRTAQLNIPSNAENNPHITTLQVRMVGLPLLAGLDGGSQIFRFGASPLLLDPDAETVITIPDAADLDGGTLRVEMISGAQAAEDVLSFSTAGTISLAATDAGSNILAGGVVIGTLNNAIAGGEVLGVTFNANATVARVQALMQAITYQNLNGSPVSGVREARVTLGYLGQKVTATISIDVQPVPVIPPAPEPETPAVVTGTVTGEVGGDPAKPVTIRDATIAEGAAVSHVVIASGVTLESDVTIGEGVIFEAPGLIEDLGALFADGITIQQLDNGQLLLTGDGIQALLLPIETVQATGGQAAGIHYGDAADVLLITAGGIGLRVYALPVDGEGLQHLLANLELQQEYTRWGRMIVGTKAGETAGQSGGGSVQALQDEEVYFSLRADLAAVLASRGDSPGLMEYPVADLGTVQHLSSLFTLEGGTLMQQDLVPAPADWNALRSVILELAGVTAVSIDIRGVIHVSIDGVLVRGVMDYTVVRGVETGAVSVLGVGDLTGNGLGDYRVTYANGDWQYLFVFE